MINLVFSDFNNDWIYTQDSSKMLVPCEALAHLKCNACNKHLSYFPIYVARNADSPMSGPLCGRCSENLIVNENYVRDTLYETMAQFLKFPCIYRSEGCIENLIPADVPNHEQNCPYRIISCALDCVWQGTVHELINHVEELHPNVLLRDGEFEMDILNSYETYSYLVHNDEIFSLKRQFNSTEKNMRCSLFCFKILETVSQYYYEITIYNGTRSLSVKFPLKRADNFQDENVTVIDVEKVKKQLDDPSMIICSVRIFTLDEQTEEKVPKKPNPELQSDMLAELECPVCFEYIIPPIFQCVTGHSICSDCKAKVTECPTCKGEIKDTHNFTLEKMAYLLTYPCKFSEFGCDFTSKPGKIKQHQKFCLLGPQECPLRDYENCKWANATKEMYSHVVTQHHDNVLEIDNLFVFIGEGYFTREEDQCYIKRFSNVLFKLHYRYARNCFYWAVQLIGPPEEANHYKFEIDILDHTNNNQKIFLRSFCAPLTDKAETFSEGKQYVFLKLEQIQPLITDQLNYFIRVIK